MVFLGESAGASVCTLVKTLRLGPKEGFATSMGIGVLDKALPVSTVHSGLHLLQLRRTDKTSPD